MGVFVYVDPDGRSWEYLGGVVRKAVPGVGSFTYAHIDPSLLVGMDANGDVAFVVDYSEEQIPQNIQSIYALSTGTCWCRPSVVRAICSM